MKQIFKTLLLVLLIFSLSACANGESQSKSNTLIVSDLSEREEAIISVTSDQAFVYDYTVDKEYTEAAVWIEKYELGELVEDKLGHITTTINERGSIIFTVSKTNEQMNYPAFHLGIGDNGGASSINTFDTEESGIDKASSVWGSFSEDEEKELSEEEVVLGYVAYSKDDGSMSSLTTDFYENPDAYMGELEQYDVTYLLKAEMMK